MFSSVIAIANNTEPVLITTLTAITVLAILKYDVAIIAALSAVIAVITLASDTKIAIIITIAIIAGLIV